MNEKKAKLLDLQNIVTIIYFIPLIVSIIITYNEKLLLLNQKPLFKRSTNNKLIISNRVFLLILVVIYLYIDYENYEIDKKYHNQLEADKLQLIASILFVISGLIILYTIIKYQVSNEDVENPTI